MSRFAQIVITHPYKVLGIISVLCIITLCVSLFNRDLPNFKDPQLGFETRGTEISQRISAWTNLLEESKPYGSLVQNPSGLTQKRSIKTVRASGTVPVCTKNSTRTADNLCEPDDDSKRGPWKELRKIQFPKREKNQRGDDIEKIYKISRNTNFFCDSINPGYGHLIISTVEPDGTLFAYEPIMEMCKFQHLLESLPNYMRKCVTSDAGSCCNIWSLPNYITRMQKLPSCGHITAKHINNTILLLETCSTYFHERKLSPDYKGKVPRSCSQNQDVYSIMQFIVDVDFLSADKKLKSLKDTSMYLPLVKSIPSLELYHDMESVSFGFKTFKVSAVDIGVKYSLFDEFLVHDIRYLSLSSIFIVICMWFYTGCAFVTLLTVTAVFLSLVNAYFIYTFVLGLEFFPFMNILAIIVSIGIGSDDAYIICKVWDRTKRENKHLSKLELVKLVIKHSVVAVFVTTLTTVAAFLSSYFSSVTAVRCFSIFAGLSVLINFAFMLTWILCGLIVSSEWPYIPILHGSFARNADVIYENILNVQSSFDDYITILIDRFHMFFIVGFGLISTLGIGAVIFWPGLQVPDSNEFQLFEKKHPFEQYDFVFKDRFRFNHMLLDDNIEEKLPLRFVWGILPVDDGRYLTPNARGSLRFDSTFDASSTASQEWLLRFCRRLRLQPFYEATFGPALSNCFVETFVTWMERECVDPIYGADRRPCCKEARFPYPRSVFDSCVVDAMASLYRVEQFLSSDVAGPRFAKTSMNPIIKVIVVEFNSNMSYTTSYEAMNTFYQQVDTWSRLEFSDAPPGMRNGWFVSHLAFYDLQRTLTRDTWISILISMAVAFAVLFFSTFNVPLSLIAIFTITCIIFVSVSILVAFGWKLNILESIAISVAIGLSVDFSLHYAVNYTLCVERNRKNRVIYALSMMAGPSLMAAATTGAAGLFMIPSVVLPYIQIGVFLIVVSSVSWIYATFFQMSLLYKFGPEDGFGQIAYPKWEEIRKAVGRSKCAKWLRSRCERSPVYPIHEMDNLETTKRVSPSGVNTNAKASWIPGRAPSEGNALYLEEDCETTRSNMYVEV